MEVVTRLESALDELRSCEWGSASTSSDGAARAIATHQTNAEVAAAEVAQLAAETEANLMRAQLASEQRVRVEAEARALEAEASARSAMDSLQQSANTDDSAVTRLSSELHERTQELELAQRELHETRGGSLSGRTPRTSDDERDQERAVQLEALERAAAALEEEREELRRTAQAAARREARRAESAELVAQELSELQAVISGAEPPAPAVLRIARERQQALAQLLPAQRRVSELEEDVDFQRKQIQRLKARNAALLERERERQGA